MQSTIQSIQQFIKVLVTLLVVSFSVSIFAAEDVTENDLIFAPQPLYPIKARTQQQEGFIEVSLNFNDQGQVIDIDILSAKNRTVFETMVLYTVSSWQLAPSTMSSRILRKRFDFALTASVPQQAYSENKKQNTNHLVTSLNSTQWNYQVYKQQFDTLKASYKAYMQRKHATPNH